MHRLRRAVPPIWSAWALLIAAHVWLIHSSLAPPREGVMYDVGLYQWWMDQGLAAGVWPVLDYSWVYPAGAIVPMLLPALVGSDYAASWCVQIAALDAVAFAVLALREDPGRRRAHRLAMCWWPVFLVLLGPVAIGRIDSVGVAFMLAAMALTLPGVPGVAGTVLATLGAWIKVFPGAVVAAALAASRRALARVVAPAAAVCAVVAAVVVALGGGADLFSFLTDQTGRTLQVESVLATPMVVARALSGRDVSFYNEALNTFEVPGSWAPVVARAADLLMIGAVGLLVVVIHRARHRAERAWPLGVLAVVTALIVFNKVGSPQYIASLAPPVVIGLAACGSRRPWPALGVLVAGVAGGTQLLWPVAYQQFLDGDLWAVAVGATRNVLLVAVLVVCTVELLRLGRRDPLDGEATDGERHERAEGDPAEGHERTGGGRRPGEEGTEERAVSAGSGRTGGRETVGEGPAGR